jgi:hypothetical protein
MSDGGDHGDYGQEHHDLHAEQEQQGNLYDQDQSYEALADHDHFAHHLHYAHGSEVHYQDQYGNEYDAREYTEVSESDESDHDFKYENYENHEREEQYFELKEFEEEFDKIFAHEGHGYEYGGEHPVEAISPK